METDLSLEQIMTWPRQRNPDPTEVKGEAEVGLFAPGKGKSDA